MQEILTKSQLRNIMFSYRKMLEVGEFIDKNNRLVKHLDEFLTVSSGKVLHIFLAITRNNEPDITHLLPKLYEKKFKVVTTKTDFKKKVLKHYFLEPDAKLINNKGIPEPAFAEVADIKQVDLILVPLLVADREGNRIGYGGGYYDRLLQETKAVKIGLSLSNPLDKIIQTDEWDVPLDYLITPYKIYKYG